MSVNCFRLNGIGFSKCGASWSLTPERTRRWPDLDLWFLVEGHGFVETPQGRQVLHPGSCLVLRGGQDYLFRQNFRAWFRHYWVHFDYVDQNDRVIRFDKAATPPLYRRLEKIEFFSGLLERAMAAFHQHPSDSQHAAHWFSAALIEVEAEDRASRSSSDQTHIGSIQWIELLCREMRAHPEKSYPVADLARKAGYSRSYFSSLFTSVAGISPQDYVVQARMREAEHLLLDSNYPISTVAEMLGYRDIFFFSRQFKIHHGVSPLQYRKIMGRSSALA